LTLYQFDIRRAFLCAPIDREIKMKLPPWYAPPPGKTALLIKSLYGLRQAQSAFHMLFKFEKWLLKYGFTAIGGDQVTFLL
ncbi:MAG: reverse transcriptase domain-containing protein, partial [bacterium]